jgi:hypothetical protein
MELLQSAQDEDGHGMEWNNLTEKILENSGPEFSDFHTYFV